MSTRQLDRALQPKSLASVCASDRPGSTGRAVLQNILQAGLPAALHLVNPRYSEIDGRACLASLRDLPAPPDLIVVARPRKM